MSSATVHHKPLAYVLLRQLLNSSGLFSPKGLHLELRSFLHPPRLRSSRPTPRYQSVAICRRVQSQHVRRARSQPKCHKPAECAPVPRRVAKAMGLADAGDRDTLDLKALRMALFGSDEELTALKTCIGHFRRSDQSPRGHRVAAVDHSCGSPSSSRNCWR